MGNFNFKQSADEMMTFIKKVESEIGPRLPATDEERAGAQLIKADMKSISASNPCPSLLRLRQIRASEQSPMWALPRLYPWCFITYILWQV